MITAEESQRLIGATVLGPESDRIGEVRQVFLDADTELPAWVGVRVGLFGGEVLVPLEGADWDERALHTPVTRSSAKASPEIDLDEPLSVEEHERLCRHYGIPSVRHPREHLDPAMFEDAAISYSVKDVGMAETDGSAPVPSSGLRTAEQSDLGETVEAASEERTEGVSGHMLARTPAPLGTPDPS